MQTFNQENTPLLFGCDRTERIVAAELAGKFIRLFIRTDKGVLLRDEPLRPFILLRDRGILDGFPGPHTVKELAGEGEFRFIATLADWHACMEARDFLARTTGKTSSAHDAPYLYLADPVHQHLLLTGKTLFKGMSFDELHRLAIDIETSCAEGYSFSNPKRAEDRIISIAIMDSRGFAEVLFADQLSEPEMLERLTRIIRELDPDVIEGHNLFRFDLEYIRIRAERYGIRLRWGRDGSDPRVHQSRFAIAERNIDYPRWDIHGRHIIDTYFLVQFHDLNTRELESYGLKQVAVHFGLASPDRVYLDRGEMDRALRETPELLKRYNLDDVRETLALSRLLSYSHFLQTRIFPYSYQNCVIRGNATKINTLFLREYLRRGEAIPRADEGNASFEGGYTELLASGVMGPVLHCDVASLYPSLMLAYGVAPARERLGLFLPLLAELRKFRLAAKQQAKEADSVHEREYFNALQFTFKILINSFYGYLGTTLHNFSDIRAAARVTSLGRQTLATMLDWLRQRGARPVEVDTDGIYFIPPADSAKPEEAEALIRELSAALPEGIEVELDGRYRAMFSYKVKNYALLDEDGRITVKGSGLKSRGLERYLREFMKEAIHLLLHGRGDRVDDLFNDYLERLRGHRFPIEWLAKTETLGENPATYRQKVQQGKRNPSAAYELALASGQTYRAGDQLSYYVTGSGKDVAAYRNCRLAGDYQASRPDENLAYYREKLRQLRQRFEPFLPAEKSLFD